MALKIKKKKGFEIVNTGYSLDECYARLSFTDTIFGKVVPGIQIFLSKEHYKNFKNSLKTHNKDITVSVNFKIEKFEVENREDLHNKFAQIFEQNGYEVEIVDLD